MYAIGELPKLILIEDLAFFIYFNLSASEVEYLCSSMMFNYSDWFEQIEYISSMLCYQASYCEFNRL